MSNRVENSRRTTTTGSGNKKEVEERDATRREAPRRSRACNSVRVTAGVGYIERAEAAAAAVAVSVVEWR